MKKILLSLLLGYTCVLTSSYAVLEGERCLQTVEAIQQATYGHIDAKGLKILMDSTTPFILLDARGDNWRDSNIIPEAMMASYQYADETLEMMIPDKEALIVVYCYSSSCPLGERLIKKLLSLGYRNILEYPGGLTEWRDVADYPVDNAV